MRRSSLVGLSVSVLLVCVLSGALPAHAEPDEGREGAELATALGCAACHSGLGIGSTVHERAPDLSGAGLRWQPGYLFAYLRDPRPIRRHIGAARMPDFRLDEREALALVLFLGEQRRLPPGAPEPPEREPAPAERGEEALLAALGAHDCLVCHTWRQKGGVRAPELADLGARLEPGFVRRFLVSPAAFGVPDGVMPALLLRPDGDSRRLVEPVPGAARDLELIVEASRELAAERRVAQDAALAAARARHPDVDAADGERVFRALNCAACHAIEGVAPREDDAPDLGNEGLRVRADWLRAYLAAPEPIRPSGGAPGSASRMPDFRLTNGEVEALAAWLGTRRRDAALLRTDFAPEPLPAHAERKARALLRGQLACLGCHRLGGEGGVIGPDLGAVARRLEPAFVEAMVREPQRLAPHAIMPKLPLGEHERDLVVRLLVHQAKDDAAPPPLLSPLDATLVTGGDPAGDPSATYARFCAPCHGVRGAGDGFNAPFLATRPTAHADAAYVATRADDTLYDGIASGGAVLDRSHLMPAWGETLAPATIAGLVREIRALCDCEGPPWSRAANAGRAPDAKPAPDTGAVADAAPEPDVAPQPDAAPPAFPPPRPRPKLPASSFADFVGAEACRPCHAAQYDAWARSTHGRAGGAPSEVRILAPFDGKPLRFRDAVVVPERAADGRLSFRVEQRGSGSLRLPVDAVVGGGHLLGGGTQSYFSRFPDGTLRFLPFDFIRDENVWFAQRRDDLSWTPVDPELSLAELANWPPVRVLGNAPQFSNCDVCHGSQIQVLPGKKGTVRTRYRSLAINCESCHGPGRRHVAWARSPDRAERADLGLEPLDTLSKDASLRVCFQCHASRPVLDPDYLPGRSFAEHFALKYLLLEANPYYPDGRIRTFSYQDNHQFSACYVDGSMTCVDCHDPHSQTYRDVFRRPLEGRFADGQCTGCHASKAVDTERHTHHPPGSPGSACTACHMPFLQEPTVGTKLRFARSDHTIPIPRPAFDEALGVKNACSSCHAERSVAELQADVERLWGPVKPHPAVIRDYLAADEVTRQEDAAALLLRPGEHHVIGQFQSLAAFARRFVAPPGAALGADARQRLEALAASDDLDVRSLALATLHFGDGDDPAVRAFLAGALADLGADDRAIRLRWSSALGTLGRVRAEAGGADGPAFARARSREILPHGPQGRLWGRRARVQ